MLTSCFRHVRPLIRRTLISEMLYGYQLRIKSLAPTVRYIQIGTSRVTKNYATSSPKLDVSPIPQVKPKSKLRKKQTVKTEVISF